MIIVDYNTGEIYPREQVHPSALVPTSRGYIKQCPTYYVHGTCEHGHEYIKYIYCGREWCPTCREKGSAAHERRNSRWYEKAVKIDSMGYFVFTIPEELRIYYKTRKSLSILNKRAQEILRDFGFARGLSRWHFFGDKSKVYNPHLNTLVDSSKVTHKVLRDIKQRWSDILDTDLVVVDYSYSESVPKKIHWVNYINRSTFLDYYWDPELAKELHNFRNNRYWGNWKTPDAWCLVDGKVDYETINKFEKGICPFCNGKITWSLPNYVDYLKFNTEELLLISPGYYLLL